MEKLTRKNIYGKWRTIPNDFVIECSICGYKGEDEKYGKVSSRIVERFNFCPNCGAKMESNY